MKLNRLETHDRLVHFKKDQEANIFQGAEDCLKRNELSLAIQEKAPYVYMFAHPRTADDGVTKVMYWDPRLSIPSCDTNSYLFRAISKTDIIEVVWMIPERHNWTNYAPGMIHADQMIYGFIQLFKNNRQKLTEPHPEDLPEEMARMIMKSIVDEKLQEVRAKNAKPVILELSSENLV